MEELAMQSTMVELGIWEVFVQSRVSISIIFCSSVPELLKTNLALCVSVVTGLPFNFVEIERELSSKLNFNPVKSSGASFSDN